MSNNVVTVIRPTYSREITLLSPDHTGLIGPHPITSRENLVDVAARLGSYFFSPSALRGFSSRVMKDIFRAGQECGYFVTSERDEGGTTPRRYTVRRYAVTRTRSGAPMLSIDNIGDFGEHGTRRGALAMARHYREREQGGLDILTASGHRYTFAA